MYGRAVVSGVMSSEYLNTKELVIISMFQTGNSPSVIALRLGLTRQEVGKFLKSPKAVAYLLEEEETTDEMLNTLYRDGAEALRKALVSPDPKVSLKAAELVFKVLGKMKVMETSDTPKVHVEKLLQVISAPPSEKELSEANRFLATGRANQPEKTVQGTVVNSE